MIIKDIWILRDNGVVLFKKCFQQIMQTQSFGMIMSAINMFAEKISSAGGLSKFEFGNLRYNLMKNDETIFVVSSESKSKEKKVMKELESISNRFSTKFDKEFFKKWNGEISCFENLDDLLKIS